jgi:hypothetical protein
MNTEIDRHESDVGARLRWWIGPPLLLVVALYVLPLAGSTPATNPNEVGRIELAASIALWARLDLEDAARVWGLSEDVAIREGRIYSDKAPGLSIAAVPAIWVITPVLPRASQADLPAYWPLRHFLTLLLVALPSAGLAFLIGAEVPDADPDSRAAVAMTAALATPLWTYGTVFFGHAPAALLVTLAWFLLIGLPGLSMPLTAGRAALGGAAAGYAVATEYPTVLLVAVIFATLLVRRTAPSHLASAVAGACAGALPAFVYHQLAFGAPWVTGYSFKALDEFQTIHSQGVLGVSRPSLEALWGVLFSARRGIFSYSPLLLLAPVGLWRMIRNRRRGAGPIVIASVVYIVFASAFVDWQAGWCAAARHLVPIVPLLTAGALMAAVKLGERRSGAIIVTILIAVSGTNAVLTIVLTPFFPPEFGSPLAQLVLPSLADGAGFANLLSSGAAMNRSAAVLCTALTALAALVWAGGRLVRNRSRWLPLVSISTVAVLLLVYSWQGASPRAETELMRAQVLRRLDHPAIADRIEGSLVTQEAARE